jgi:hypothetical protein
MSKETTVRASASGIGFAGLLTIALIVLKIAGVGIMADASWLWCFAPLVVVPALAIAFVLFAAFIMLMAVALDSRGR